MRTSTPAADTFPVEDADNRLYTELPVLPPEVGVKFCLQKFTDLQKHLGGAVTQTHGQLRTKRTGMEPMPPMI